MRRKVTGFHDELKGRTGVLVCRELSLHQAGPSTVIGRADDPHLPLLAIGQGCQYATFAHRLPLGAATGVEGICCNAIFEVDGSLSDGVEHQSTVNHGFVAVLQMGPAPTSLGCRYLGGALSRSCGLLH